MCFPMSPRSATVGSAKSRALPLRSRNSTRKPGQRARLLLEPLEQRAVPAILRASYLFQDTLNAEQRDAPALVAIDPLGLSRFESAQVYGQTREVFHLEGERTPAENEAGLSLDATGVIPITDYSVEMVFEFTEINDFSGWRKIVDVHERRTDTGLYINPNNVLSVFDGEDASQELAAGHTEFSTPGFHHVVLTVGPDVVGAFLDGGRELTTPVTHVMNLEPRHLMHFLLDDLSTGSEYANSRIALMRLYAGQLNDGEVAALAQNPFASDDGDHDDGDHHDGHHHHRYHREGEYHQGEHHDGEHHDGQDHEDDHDDDHQHDGNAHDGEHFDGEFAVMMADLHVGAGCEPQLPANSARVWPSDHAGPAATFDLHSGSEDKQARAEVLFGIAQDEARDTLAAGRPALDLAIVEWTMLNKN